jgi:hypothetical protein
LMTACKIILDTYHRQRVYQCTPKTGWVYLKAEYLRNQVGSWRIADQAKAALIRRGVLECNRSFTHPTNGEPGEGKCMGYRLGEQWRPKTFRLVPAPARHQLRKNKYTTQAVVTWLRRNLARIQVTIPTRQQLQAIANPTGLRTQEQTDELADIFRDQLSLLRDQPIIFEIDEFGRRIHTPLTRLKSELRRYLTVNGQHPIELDIKNCQPTCLAIELLAQGIKCPRYLEVCQQGLYEFVANELGIERGEAKGLVIEQFFFGKRRCRPVEAVFESHFPEVVAFIRKTKAKDYKKLARLLQRRESKIVIYTVCEQIRQTRPDSWINTIHDSILCVPRDRDFVKVTLENEFKRCGIEFPSIKEKHHQ